MTATAGNLALVVNPAAGRGRASRLVPAVHDRLASAGHAVQVVAEVTPEATAKAVREVRGSVDGLVALGGDGLVHLLLPEIAQSGVPLGIVPAGTGNDLAVALGIPPDPLRAVALVGARDAAAFDAVRTGERWWASVLCAGFDSAINERVNRMRWPRGPRRYALGIFAELAALHTDEFSIDVDGTAWHGPATLVAVGNTWQYGGGYRMCAGADPCDGLLDVVIIGRVGRAELVRMLPRVRAGTHLGHPALTRLRGRRVTLAAEGVVAYADGERVAPLPVTADCVPGALRIWVPAEKRVGS